MATWIKLLCETFICVDVLTATAAAQIHFLSVQRRTSVFELLDVKGCSAVIICLLKKL